MAARCWIKHDEESYPCLLPHPSAHLGMAMYRYEVFTFYRIL